MPECGQNAFLGLVRHELVVFHKRNESCTPFGIQRQKFRLFCRRLTPVLAHGPDANAGTEQRRPFCNDLAPGKSWRTNKDIVAFAAEDLHFRDFEPVLSSDNKHSSSRIHCARRQPDRTLDGRLHDADANEIARSETWRVLQACKQHPSGLAGADGGAFRG